ncbi:MAG TPA: STAS domain-containing protein [Ferrovibrio sp.]|jgi:chemotaxis protein CheX|uniref:STAS domain-containing protein n=1 Tax=Ferrovibrio sp. TaxID=1917215 RepID=UPI002B4AD8C3|nr:STAS domain-containing protein [Ferrovibrio sp.]HLT77053.1 STAS domain-containing protein [Ferrovibrio sp.]
MEPFTITKTDDAVQLGLVASMDLRAAEPLLHTFHEALGHNGKIVIDASAVDRLSTPCVQILLSAAQHMEQHNIPFVIRSPSDAFVTAFDDLGLFSFLMKWPVET